MLRKLLLAPLVLLLTCAVASAAPTIVAGHHVLLPNTPGQVIQIITFGEPNTGPLGAGDAFQGVDLHLLIGDGTDGPIMSNVDIVGPGTLFFGNNFGQSDFGPPYVAPGREVVAMTSTQTGEVGPNGILAFVTIDTTGIFGGTWDLLLDHPLFGPSDLPPWGPGDALLQNGSLTVIPEPGSIVLGLFGAAGVAAVAIRRRRARNA